MQVYGVYQYAQGNVMATYSKNAGLADNAFNYQTIGGYIQGTSGWGVDSVESLLKHGYQNSYEFKRLIGKLVITHGFESTLLNNYSLSDYLGYDKNLALPTLQAYYNDLNDYDWLIRELLDNGAFRQQAIDGLYNMNQIGFTQAVLDNDQMNHDLLMGYSLYTLNLVVDYLMNLPPQTTNHPNPQDAINDIISGFSNDQIANVLASYFYAETQTALSTMPSSTLGDAAQSSNFWMFNPGGDNVLNLIVPFLNVDDVSSWLLNGGDPVSGRAKSYIISLNPYVLVYLLAANNNANYIQQCLDILNNLDIVYSEVMSRLPNHTAQHFANMVKSRHGESYYNTMMSTLSTNLRYVRKLTVQDHSIYGSSRLGIKSSQIPIYHKEFDITGIDENGLLEEDNIYVDETTLINTAPQHRRYIGQKMYELSNHLGNVLATILDRRILVETDPNNAAILGWDADVHSAQDYYAFGMTMPGRNYSTPNKESYRYGFNGMEKDDDWSGKGNSYDFGARIYDSRLGRWLAVDGRQDLYVPNAPYAFAINNPIIFVDSDGNVIYDSKGNRVKIKYNTETGEISEIKGTDDKRLIQLLVNTYYHSEEGKTAVSSMNSSKVKYHIAVHPERAVFQSPSGKHAEVLGLSGLAGKENIYIHIYGYDTENLDEITISDLPNMLITDKTGTPKDPTKMTDEQKEEIVEDVNKLLGAQTHTAHQNSYEDLTEEEKKSYSDSQKAEKGNKDLRNTSTLIYEYSNSTKRLEFSDVNSREAQKAGEAAGKKSTAKAYEQYSNKQK